MQRAKWSILVLVIAIGSVLAYGLTSLYNGRQTTTSQASPITGLIKARLETDTGLLNGSNVVVLGPENSSIYVYIFYDSYCPYCAREFTEDYSILSNLASEYKVILVDTIIHQESPPIHGILRCAAENGAPILDVLNWWYKNLLEGKDPGTSGLVKKLSTYNIQVNDTCIRSQENIAWKNTVAAQSIGVQGTPTLVIYSPSKHEILGGAMGYLPPSKLQETIQNAIQKAKS